MKKTLLSFVLLFALETISAQSRLIWTAFGQGRIETGNLDGTERDTLLSFDGSSDGLAFDAASQAFYFTNGPQNAIMKMPAGAQSAEVIVSGLELPEEIVIDPVNNKIYWSDWGQNKIQRANMDGSGTEDIYQETSLHPKGLFLDTISQNLYFSQQSGVIAKIDLNTLIIDTITTASGVPTKIEVDMDTGKIYWSNQDFAGSKIQRCNLDGSGAEDIAVGLGLTYGIAIDKAAGKIYWTDWGGDFPKYLKRANLDGNDIEGVFEFTGYSPYALIIVDGLVSNSKEVLFENNISTNVFPNPVAGFLNIEIEKLNEKFSVEIYDSRGILINSTKNNKYSARLDFSGYASGIYLLKIKSGNKVAWEKVVRS
ncbi:MAG TPA: T9SS type A sorting domain-containing protein [Bacteroidetes bacterium]|nr:T9SS type A sorting domain-containing protein [Bacteroidota bacterium]